MGIALLAGSALASPFTALCALHKDQTPQGMPAMAAVPASPKSLQSGHHAAHSPAVLPPSIRPPRPHHHTLASQTPLPDCSTLDRPFPLRVLHTHGSGRMAIAGRMAEVCAELDRLIASELRH